MTFWKMMNGLAWIISFALGFILIKDVVMVESNRKHDN